MKQNNKRQELPLSTARLISALCGEYIRMQDGLKDPALDPATREIYRYYTSILLTEAEHGLSLCGCQAEEMIVDISENRGYPSSQIAKLISRKRYYCAKARIMTGMAKRLNLI